MKKTLSCTLLALLIIPFCSCRKKKTIDSLYEESKSTALVFYKNKDTIYDPAGGSPHGTFRLKFNATAAAALGTDGKLPAGGSFETGSLIVKEVMKNGALDHYAVMKKDPGSKYAASKWIWAELRTDGSEIYSISKRGEACTGCHSSNVNRDMTRSFDLH
jgi:hypothetical protein